MATRRTTAEELAALTATFEAFISQQKERDVRAEEQQKATNATLRTLETNQADLLRRMDLVEPVTNMVTNWRFIAIGAIAVLGAVGTAVTVAARLAWGYLTDSGS